MLMFSGCTVHLVNLEKITRSAIRLQVRSSFGLFIDDFGFPFVRNSAWYDVIWKVSTKKHPMGPMGLVYLPS